MSEKSCSVKMRLRTTTYKGWNILYNGDSALLELIGQVVDKIVEEDQQAKPGSAGASVQMIEHAHEMGYETMANLMAVSNITETEIDTVLEAIRPTPAGTMVIGYGWPLINATQSCGTRRSRQRSSGRPSRPARSFGPATTTSSPPGIASHSPNS